MVINKTNKTKKLYSILGVVMLGIVGISTVSINKTYAADVYPTITNTQQTNELKNNNQSSSLTESLGDIFSQFFTFVKEGIEKNNTKNKHNFDISKDTNNLLNNNILSNSNIKTQGDDNFIDIKNHPDKYYINYLSNQNIISKNKDKFNPDNFIRLHELSKLLVNSYRFKLGYNINKNIGLTNKNYFSKTMPKYYNTAYEMGLLEGVYDTENFERFIAYDDIQKILSNFQAQYPKLVNIDYLDIKQSDQTLKRGEVCRNIVKTMMFDTKDKNSIFTDTIGNKYGEAIEQLASLKLVNTDNDKFYPNNRITRGEFIEILVNSYLESNNLELKISNLNFNIDDLDYNSNYAPFIVYAQEQGLTNYLFETKRGKTYINTNMAVTKDEAYHIISQAALVKINYDVTQADKEYITRGEVAQIISDSFNFKSDISYRNSQLETFVDSVKSFTESKKLLSLLF